MRSGFAAAGQAAIRINAATHGATVRAFIIEYSG
jgi:hypothetical protein